VQRLDIRGQHFTCCRNSDGSMLVCAEVSAHVSAVGAISPGDEGSVLGGSHSAPWGGVGNGECLSGGVNSSCRGAGVYKFPARRVQSPAAGNSSNIRARCPEPRREAERSVCLAPAAICPEAAHEENAPSFDWPMSVCERKTIAKGCIMLTRARIFRL
jgi:hypothetical protein